MKRALTAFNNTIYIGNIINGTAKSADYLGNVGSGASASNSSNILNGKRNLQTCSKVKRNILTANAIQVTDNMSIKHPSERKYPDVPMVYSEILSMRKKMKMERTPNRIIAPT